jgi:phage shock protein A
MLVARNRRARTVGKANSARSLTGTQETATALKRLRTSILEREATNSAHTQIESESIDDRLITLEREDQIDRLLEDLKSRQPRLT